MVTNIDLTNKGNEYDLRTSINTEDIEVVKQYIDNLFKSVDDCTITIQIKVEE